MAKKTLFNIHVQVYLEFFERRLTVSPSLNKFDYAVLKGEGRSFHYDRK